MQIVVRTDASLQIGSGHVMRCLTLADELREQGAAITFICREHPGNLNNLIAAKGYEVVRLTEPAAEYSSQPDDVAHAPWLGVSWQSDAAEVVAAVGERHFDWLIVDHYALDRRWEERLRSYVDKIMVIDDLADRQHDCDLLLDQNLYRNMERRYDGRVPDGCRRFLGPRYALLRPEFRSARERQRNRDGVVRRILIFFGGSDPTNETFKALQSLRMIDRPDIMVDVVVGAANPNKEKIKILCQDTPSFVYHCQIENMAELMATADLALGGGGSTTWERCFLGLPTIAVVIAENQATATDAVALAGASWNAGWFESVTVTCLADIIGAALRSPEALRKMSCNAQLLVGDSGANIIAKAITEV